MPIVRLSRRAAKDLDALPAKAARRIAVALEAIANDPRGETHDIKALVGRRPWYRLRVGNYRILFRREAHLVLVARVIDRKELDRAVRSLSE